MNLMMYFIVLKFFWNKYCVGKIYKFIMSNVILVVEIFFLFLFLIFMWMGVFFFGIKFIVFKYSVVEIGFDL